MLKIKDVLMLGLSAALTMKLLISDIYNLHSLFKRFSSSLEM